MENQLLGKSHALLQILNRVSAVANTEAPVLITGESGVGKELIASQIHVQSKRAMQPFVCVNCASIPRELFESEFFGHVKGAFTGAVSERKGRLELAHKGTLFLDEVGEIPLELQAKLLRALQQQAFERLGEEKTRTVDIRIISATNRNLINEIDSGLFREDLFYRLSVFPIDVAPLRKRKEDIPVLAKFFFDNLCINYAKPFSSLSEEQLQLLSDYDWPGNVRQLKSVIERAVILSHDVFRLDLAMPEEAMKEVNANLSDLSQTIPRRFYTDKEFRRLERLNIISALEHAKWKVSGKKGAAELLGIKTTTLNSKMRALSIQRPGNSSLYIRLGGIVALTSFVDELLPKLRADSSLGRYWNNRGIDSIRKEKQYLIEYLSKITGGPHEYTGRDMSVTHAGLKITDNDWRNFLEIVDDILTSLKIKSDDANDIKKLLIQLQDEIVNI